MLDKDCLASLPSPVTKSYSNGPLGILLPDDVFAELMAHSCGRKHGLVLIMKDVACTKAGAQSTCQSQALAVGRRLMG